MKKYFVCSDIHSFYTSLVLALTEHEFDLNNDDHILVVCGDIFDRGDETLAVYKFLKSLPKSRLVLIKGNHEQLYLELLEKEYPDKIDFHNGTVKTFCHIAKINPDFLDFTYLLCTSLNSNIDDVHAQMYTTWQKVREKVKKSAVTRFIKSRIWKNYYELDNYVFVHSFIPLQIKDIPETKWQKHWPTFQVSPEYLETIPNWRDCKSFYWEDATWGCPWSYYREGLFDEEIKNGKTLVCGHWHSSDFYKHLDGYKDKEIEEICPIYYGKNIIAIDACTAYTNRTNVLVIDEK